MIHEHQYECRTVMSLEAKGNETFKSKIRLFQEDTRKKPLIFQHENVETSLLHVLKSTKSAHQISEQTTELKI
jgi:hypothetical protein